MNMITLTIQHALTYLLFLLLSPPPILVLVPRRTGYSETKANFQIYHTLPEAEFLEEHIGFGGPFLLF